MRKILALAALLLTPFCAAEAEDDLRPVDVYEQDFLLELISKNQHLQQIQSDDCQIVEDIRYRAEHARYPSFQYLYADMLLFGVCVDKNIRVGWSHLNAAAAQGLPEANEQIGRYYVNGKFVQQDPKRALPYLRLAAMQDNLQAQLGYVELLNQGIGTVHEYVQGYNWLYNSLIDDSELHSRAEQLLSELATKMNRRMLEQARKPRRY